MNRTRDDTGNKTTKQIAFDYEGSHTSYVEEQTFGSHR